VTQKYVEGQALVASPHLADRNFLRAVVYIVKHDEDGAYGLILNRPTDATVADLMRQVMDEEVENPAPIFHGGPVEGPIVVIHDAAIDGATCVEPGICVSSEQDEVAAICRQNEKRYRVFNGYAGWAPQQLEDELKQGGWLVWRISKEDLFASPDEIWHSALRHIGREILLDSIVSGPIPEDPSVN